MLNRAALKQHYQLIGYSGIPGDDDDSENDKAKPYWDTEAERRERHQRRVEDEEERVQAEDEADMERLRQIMATPQKRPAKRSRFLSDSESPPFPPTQPVAKSPPL